MRWGLSPNEHTVSFRDDENILKVMLTQLYEYTKTIELFKKESQSEGIDVVCVSHSSWCCRVQTWSLHTVPGNGDKKISLPLTERRAVLRIHQTVKR